MVDTEPPNRIRTQFPSAHVPTDGTERDCLQRTIVDSQGGISFPDTALVRTPVPLSNSTRKPVSDHVRSLERPHESRQVGAHLLRGRPAAILWRVTSHTWACRADRPGDAAGGTKTVPPPNPGRSSVEPARCGITAESDLRRCPTNRRCCREVCRLHWADGAR